MAELSGKAAFGNGFATQLRPKKYYTISKESLERFLDDVEQLINFVVIEFQRILFAENIWVTCSVRFPFWYTADWKAFVASFVSYYLIKWLPLWGLSLIGTTLAFVGPLVYLQNKDMIDGHIDKAGNVINAQAAQVRDLAAQHTTRATETVKTYAGEYTKKAQDMVGNARGKTNGVKSADLPTAPKSDPLPNVPTGTPAQPQAAY
jgi:Reticulon